MRKIGPWKSLFIIYLFCLTSQACLAEEWLVIFAANLESEGGVHREDASGADLYSVRFDPQLKTVSNITRLTNDQYATEWFPSLSPDTRWVAYNYARQNQHEVRVMNLLTGDETIVFTGGRFPEWIDDSKLLVANAIQGVKDIFLLSLDVSGTIPQVRQTERITDRVLCPNTSMAGDGYPFPGEEKIAFHVLRASGEEGAAMAVINIDGTGYQRITDWDGSGHGIINSTGDEIVCSVSGTSRPRVLFLDQEPLTLETLPLPINASAFTSYDARFENSSTISWSYAAWADHDHALFMGTQGSSAQDQLSFSRLFYVDLDEQWKNPDIYDFSTAVENLAGKTGRDFCTASARQIPQESIVENEPIYVCLFMHNEDFFHDSYPDYSLEVHRVDYIESRNNLLVFCQVLNSHNIPFNWQTDWNFLYGVFKWDTPNVTANTGGKNIVRYIHEDLNITVDPHSHENVGHNYTDVAHLIDSLGVTPTNVIGGHIWDPSDAKYQDWERFKQPLPGMTYPYAIWKGNVLMGHGTAQHVNDPEPSGVWKPTGKYQFWTHDETGAVCAVGQYTNSLPGIVELVALRANGAIASDKILTACIGNNQFSLDPAYTGWYENTIVQPLIDMQDGGEIQIVTFEQLIEIWKTQYDSTDHIYNTPTSIKVEPKSHRPKEYGLDQNYPNPFNPSTTIQFSLPERALVRLMVFDLMGRRITTLADEMREAGHHSILFEPIDLPSGVYFVRLETPTFTQTRTMELVK